MDPHGEATIPFQPERAGSPPGDAVEEALAQYYERASSGPAPAIEAFAQRVADEVLRERLVEAQQLLAAGLPQAGEPVRVLGGRYRIQRELGRGGFGVVYEAHDEELDRRVALKAIRAAGPAELARLEQSLLEESRSLARVPSKDIVTVHDVVRDGDEIFLVLELVRGGDLGGVLAQVRKASAARGPAVRAEAWHAALGGEAPAEPGEWHVIVARVVLRIARALESAHAAGVLHRDMKPSNVLLDAAGEPKLVDFGLAYRAGASDAGASSLAGTPEYMAPEQVAAGATGASRSSDVWGLGLIAYEMLALERAFARGKGEGLPALFERIRGGDRHALRERDPGLPPALVAIVEHALALDPARRYPSMSELALDLERFLAGRAPLHAPLALRERLALDARRLVRNPRAWAATFLLAALGGWGLTLLAEKQPLVVQSAQVFRKAEGVVRPLADGERVGASDDLGVRVAGGKSGVLYTFSVFKRPGSELEYLVPTQALRLDRYEDTREDFGLRLPPGDHDVIVAEVSPDSASEGVEVYVCDSERPLFEEWLHALDDLARKEAVIGGVERSRAEALLQRLAGELRGSSPGSRDLARRREAYEEIRRARQAEDGSVRLFRRSFAVERGE